MIPQQNQLIQRLSVMDNFDRAADIVHQVTEKIGMKVINRLCYIIYVKQGFMHILLLWKVSLERRTKKLLELAEKFISWPRYSHGMWSDEVYSSI